ncbi:hypothetical protein ACFQ51_01785 [Streptomyces kaempferi]
MDTGHRGTQAGALEPAQRRAVQVLGIRADGEQSPAVCLDARRPVAGAGPGRPAQLPQGLVGLVLVSGTYGRLDELGQRPVADALDAGIGAGQARGFQRLLVSARTVVEDGASPLKVGQRHAFAPRHRVPGRGADRGKGLVVPAAEDGEPHLGVGDRAGTGHAGDVGSRLGQRRGLQEFTAQQVQSRTGGRGDREDADRPSYLARSQQPRGQQSPGLVVPQQSGAMASQPQPIQFLLRGQFLRGESRYRPAQYRNRGAAAFDDEERQSVQQEVRGAWHRRRGHPASAAGDLRDPALVTEPPASSAAARACR